MAENRAPPDEAVMIVDIEKVLPLRKQAGDEGDLVAVLGDVSLQGQIGIFAPQRARGFQLRRRARSGPARRDGIEQAALAMPSIDQRLGLVVARLRRIA